jgi:uncharacterized membrane protein YgcG
MIAYQYKIRKEKELTEKIDFNISDVNLHNTKIIRIKKPVAEKIILEYEWLHSMPFANKYFFGIYFTINNIDYLGGVLVFGNEYSENTGVWDKYCYTNKILLLSRGVCLWWTPKNTASYFISKACDWIKNNTQYRIITATVDPAAGEIGTIYQSLNWKYVGLMSGNYNKNCVSTRFGVIIDGKLRFSRWVRNKLGTMKKVKKVFGEPEYDYYLTIDKTKNVNKLTEYEKLVINFLFDKTTENLDSLENVKTDKIELNKAFKETSTKFSLISSFQKKCAQFTKEYTEKFYRKSSGGLYKKLFLYIVMVLAAISINTIFVSPLYINAKFITIIVSSVILLFNSIILLLIIYNCSFIIRDEYVNEYKMLKGLKKYLDDYSLIKDRYPIEIALWDRYLVFASLLGIAPKVAKEFKEELIKNGYDDNYIYTYYPILNMSMNSAVITASAGASTGSAGSGGYSGGGGGGRRWWRRRCLLNLKI